MTLDTAGKTARQTSSGVVRSGSRAETIEFARGFVVRSDPHTHGL